MSAFFHKNVWFTLGNFFDHSNKVVSSWTFSWRELFNSNLNKSSVHSWRLKGNFLLILMLRNFAVVTTRPFIIQCEIFCPTWQDSLPEYFISVFLCLKELLNYDQFENNLFSSINWRRRLLSVFINILTKLYLNVYVLFIHYLFILNLITPWPSYIIVVAHSVLIIALFVSL